MQEIDCTEIFESGEVQLKIYHYVDEQLDPIAYLRVGHVAELQLRPEDFDSLVEIIDLYRNGVEAELWEENS